MQNKLIKLLRKDARLTNEELGIMLGISAKEIADEIEQLENNGIIKGYTAILDESKLEDTGVTAVIEVKVMPSVKYGYKSVAKIIARFPEVESVRLIAGDYDFSVTVKCPDLNSVGMFVADKISPIEGIVSISTHFIMGRYKELGREFDLDNDIRGVVSP
ncbi:MAG: Lrp/AsnC family transcriptional regulator [Oscillospiraceae bacterium]|nr:Lrp/AsnC family transcriptional regulator [Oscillospiraceae bacterium]